MITMVSDRLSANRRSIRSSYVTIHPLGRLFFGMGGFAAALVAHGVVFAATGTGLSLILLRMVNRSWTPVFRAVRLLLWLILPICLLHLLLTPGALIWPGSGLPLTWEGVDRAVWLSTRLFFLFFSAMLLSRLLSLEEWQAQLCRIPVVGCRLYPYLQLFQPMQKITAELARKHWRESRSRGITSMPEMIVCLLEDVLRSGHDQAKLVWEGWKGELPSCDLKFDGRALALMVLGISLPFGAWVA
ncbi:MAG: hypothetical protein Q9M24_09140 [Mariprofundaceae bacterium]|nr:hypothetical protein [Mariprofundaceae bacterium]